MAGSLSSRTAAEATTMAVVATISGSEIIIIIISNNRHIMTIVAHATPRYRPIRSIIDSKSSKRITMTLIVNTTTRTAWTSPRIGRVANSSRAMALPVGPNPYR